MQKNQPFFTSDIRTGEILKPCSGQRLSLRMLQAAAHHPVAPLSNNRFLPPPQPSLTSLLSHLPRCWQR